MKNKLILILLATFSFFGSIMFATENVFADQHPDLCQVFNRTLQSGDSGPDVKRLQVVLGQEGVAYLNATGVYNSATARAVKSFQRLAGIYPAGKVGPQTFKRMQQLWCSSGIGNSGNIYNNTNINTNSNINTSANYNPSGGTANVTIQPTVSNGNNITLAWTSTNAQSCTLNNQNIQTNGSQIFPVYNETTFTISCLDYSGRNISKTITVKPNQDLNSLPSVQVSINPSTALINTTATLYWTSRNTQSCSVNNSPILQTYTGAVTVTNSAYQAYPPNNNSTNGSQQIYVTGAAVNYIVTCVGINGQTVSATVSAGATPLPPTIGTAGTAYIYSTPQSIVTSGSPVTLTWTSTNTNYCSLSGGGQNYSGLNGTQVVYPTTTTTYQISCTATNGQNVSYQTTVNVNTGNGGLSITADANTDAQNYRNQVGQTINVYCPANLALTNIWGTDIYSDDSSICSAAAHAGKINIYSGGNVSILIGGSQNSFSATTRNGVTSLSYGYWPGSFTIVNTTSNNSGVTMTVATDKTNYNIGETIGMAAVITNNSANTISFNSSYCVAVGFLLDGNDPRNAFSTAPGLGQQISCQVASPGYAVVTLNPGQSQTFSFSTVAQAYMNGTSNSSAGSHTVTASVTTSTGQTITGQSTFTIGGTGTNGNGITLISNSGNQVSVQVGNANTGGGSCIQSLSYGTINWGDGQSTQYTLTSGCSTANLTHAYSSSGTYNISTSVGGSLTVVVNAGTNTGAPTATLTPSITNISSGQAVTFYLATTNVSTCNLTGGQFSNTYFTPNSTSISFNPTQTTTYTVSCTGTNGQTISNQSIITVNGTTSGSNIITTFTSNITNVTSGQPVTLTWTATNANSCAIGVSPTGTTNIPVQSSNGSYLVYPTVTTTYSLLCYNYNNSTAYSNAAYVTVNVNGGNNNGNVTANLTANYSNVTNGQPVTLTWTSTNANTCSITGNNINIISQQGPSGNTTVYPTQSTNYVLTCYNNNGQNSTSFVYVTTNNNGGSGNITANISANNPTITSGQQETISWYSSGASTCSVLVNGNTVLSNQNVSGTYLAYPTQSTIYGITCTNSSTGQSVTNYAYVTVNGNNNTNGITLLSNSNRQVTIQYSNDSYMPLIINWGDGQVANTSSQFGGGTQGHSFGTGQQIHYYNSSGQFNLYITSNGSTVGTLQVYVQ